ncbi:MAG: hypothetical protein K0S33_2478 [Bacteroidetes bacterium]|jgi:hypothetical protein|nr:hypothetical protein [Bacteroidota bacterium]
MNTNKIRVALYMARMSVSEKLNKAKRVMNAILTNSNVFTSPGTAVSDLATATTNLENAWNNAEDGGKSLTAIMHDREKIFDAAMIHLAYYVELTANGDPEIIHLAGLDVRPTPNHTGPASFEAKHGDGNGSINLKVKAVKGASYLWEYSVDNATWVDAGGTKQSRTEINGLTPGSRYWFRYALIDKDGQQPWSEPLSIIVV